MPTYVSTNAANSMLAGPGLRTTLAGGKLQLFSTAQAGPGSTGGTMLVEIELGPTAGAVVGGVLSLVVPTDDALSVTAGDPLWARFCDSLGNWLIDCRARLEGAADDPGDPAPVVIEGGGLLTGAVVRVASATISFGA